MAGSLTYVPKTGYQELQTGTVHLSRIRAMHINGQPVGIYMDATDELHKQLVLSAKSYIKADKTGIDTGLHVKELKRLRRKAGRLLKRAEQTVMYD